MTRPPKLPETFTNKKIKIFKFIMVAQIYQINQFMGCFSVDSLKK